MSSNLHLFQLRTEQATTNQRTHTHLYIKKKTRGNIHLTNETLQKLAGKP